MRKIEIDAPAKLNVFLDVKRPVRADGFHELVSLTGKISLFDTVSVEKADKITLDISSPWKISAGKKNICFAAAGILRKKVHFPGARIKLIKRIPPGQGMGGGSSDGAAVIKAINKLWDLRLSEKAKMSAAAATGSDVALFLMPSSFVWIRGRGEKTEISRRKIRGVVVVWFGRPLSTRKVYECFDKMPCGKFCGNSYDMGEGISGPAGKTVFFNVLDEAAFKLRPVIAKKVKMLLAAGASEALMTGSGSAVFGVFKNAADAEKFVKRRRSCKIARFL